MSWVSVVNRPERITRIDAALKEYDKRYEALMKRHYLDDRTPDFTNLSFQNDVQLVIDAADEVVKRIADWVTSRKDVTDKNSAREPAVEKLLLRVSEDKRRLHTVTGSYHQS